MDYTEDAFKSDGFYLVTYGGDPVPQGPYPTVFNMACEQHLFEYPDNGYVVFVENGEVSNVPSLNPDDLLSAATITRDDIKLRFDEDDGTVVLSVKDVDVVEVVLHGFWNGTDDYYMQKLPEVPGWSDEPEFCQHGGFMLASWRYDARNLAPQMSAAENGEYFRLWSQPLPTKDEDA